MLAPIGGARQAALELSAKREGVLTGDDADAPSAKSSAICHHASGSRPGDVAAYRSLIKELFGVNKQSGNDSQTL